MSKLIIGIVGVAGSGKSTICDYACEHWDAATVSIAEPLKESAKPFGFTWRQLYGPSEARNEPHPTLRMRDGSPMTARKYCELVGERLIAECPNAFIAPAMELVRASTAKIVVLPDVRLYKSAPEMQYIREAGGKLILRTTTAPLTSDHYSNVEHLELPRNYFDAILPQFADKTQLYDAIDELITRWTR